MYSDKNRNQRLNSPQQTGGGNTYSFGSTTNFPVRSRRQSEDRSNQLKAKRPRLEPTSEPERELSRFAPSLLHQKTGQF